MSNWYVTVRSYAEEFYVNTISFDGKVSANGHHGYVHRRSARRAAIALAKKLDVSYRQDLEYTVTPHAFIAKVTV